MTIGDLIRALELSVIGGEAGLDREVTGGFVTDLLSEAMRQAAPGQLLITVQRKVNVIAVAFFCDLSGVLVANGAKVDRETIEKANEKGIPLLVTQKPVFELAGKFYEIMER
ncbi:MAG: DRTGG domain-containing protein [Bacteroidota bacterium]